jgi:ketosteroid isomerase-like protein
MQTRCAIVGVVDGQHEDDPSSAEVAAQRAAEEVEAANTAFYDAFEQRDFDRMSDCWEHSPRVVCTHPGWSTLHGWSSVSASWFALVTNAQRLQFILTNTVVSVEGDAAWVNCDENILDTESSNTVAALNMYVRAPGSTHGWLLVAHHGSVVYASAEAP